MKSVRHKGCFYTWCQKDSESTARQQCKVSFRHNYPCGQIMEMSISEVKYKNNQITHQATIMILQK